MKIKFIEDFANNWKAGQIVECIYLYNRKVLVDNVAEIDLNLLLNHCKVINESERTND